MTRHSQRHIEWAGQEADIDEGIADLILALWQCGLRTQEYSCQASIDAEEEPGMVTHVCIELDAESASLLFEFVQAVDPWSGDDLESLANRMIGDFEPPDWEEFQCNRVWKYSTGPPSPGVPFGILVEFPATDVPEVIRLLEPYR